MPALNSTVFFKSTLDLDPSKMFVIEFLYKIQLI